MKVVSNNRGKDRVNDRGKDRGKGKGQEKGQEQAVALTETTVGPVNRATRAMASTPAVCGRCILECRWWLHTKRGVLMNEEVSTKHSSGFRKKTKTHRTACSSQKQAKA